MNNIFYPSSVNFSGGIQEKCFSITNFKGIISGEACFTTGMLGYQHSISDPSFAGQVLFFSTPHIANVGINYDDFEAKNISLKAIVIDEEPEYGFHHSSYCTLVDCCNSFNIPLVFGVDMRKIIRYIRTNPSASTVIAVGNESQHNDYEKYFIQSDNYLTGVDLSADYRTVQNPLEIKSVNVKTKYKIAIIDFGVKQGIIDCINDFADVVIIPAKKDMSYVVDEYAVDAVVLSNGPGDPSATYLSLKDDIDKIVNSGKVIFGICLGHQIIGLMHGAKVSKMCVGHRGANHPVFSLIEDKRSLITSQNHGFVVTSEGLSDDFEITYVSGIDNSVEGISSKDGRIFSVQFHPEGSPGTYDSHSLFKEFKNAIVCR